MRRPFPHTRQIEVRGNFEIAPLNLLAGVEGFTKDRTAIDFVRATLYTCCYLKILLTPAWNPPTAFRDECRFYADFLFRESLPIIEAGCTTRVQNMVPMIDINSPEIRDFERSLLQGFRKDEKENTHLHLIVPKGLWTRVKKEYRIIYGDSNAGFARLLAGLLYQVESIVTAADHSG